MKIIKKSVPKDSMVVRAGGDEIYIIIPNSDKDFADKCCNLIKTNLQNNAVLIAGLSIELASSDSTNANIDSLITLTDNKVTDIKATIEEVNSPVRILLDDFFPLPTPDSVANNENKSWEELNNLINISTYEFLQNFRLSKNFRFNSEQITDTSNFIIDSFIYLLNKKLHGKLPENITKLIKEDYPYIPEYNSNNDNKNDDSNHLDSATCNLIHSLVSADINIDFNKLSDENIKKLTDILNNLLEKLVRDNTGLLDKQYFRHTLSKELCNSNKEYVASYLTVSGIKLSNFAFNHTFTDRRLDKTNLIICTEAEKELHYNNKSFDFSDDNIYLTSQAGGNYLALYPKNIAHIVQPKIQSFVDKITDSINIKDPNGPFKIACYHMSENQTIPNANPE